MNIFDKLREKLRENTFTDYNRPPTDDKIITQEDALAAIEEIERDYSDRNIEKEALCTTQDNDVRIGRVVFKAGTTLYHCPNCNSGLLYSQKYCSECGQKVRIRRVKCEGDND